jgi:PAS domain S-box-containing protein
MATLRPAVAAYELAAMLAGFADLVSLHDLDGRTRLASESFRTILGLAPNELIGRMPEDSFVLAEDAPLLRAAMDRVDDGHESVEVLFRASSSHGELEWLETRIGAVRGRDSSVSGFVAVSRVVTERLDAEGRSQARLDRYHQVTGAVAGMTTFIVDGEHRCRFAAGAGFSSMAKGPGRMS